jgi:hypothetical protein
MAPDIHQKALIVQRAALLRAIERAREYRADNDAEILGSIVLLIEELYRLAPRAAYIH